MTFLPWLKRFGARTGKAASSFSLLLLSVAAFAADYADAARKLNESSSDEAKLKVLRELRDDPGLDQELRSSLLRLSSGNFVPGEIGQIERMVEVRAMAQSAPKPPQGEHASQTVAEIKKSPLYRDAGDKEESNWISKAFERLGGFIQKMLENLAPRRINGPNLGGGGGFLAGLIWLVWGSLGAVLLAFLYFVFRHFSWKKGLEHRAKAILGEEEPELSRDEYLAEADRLIGEGCFREAVRYLYLACLLLFDEHGVAGFIRGQTNWEHLRRIESSASMPESLDFQPATRTFDQVWYGMKSRGEPDVDAMRGWYVQVADRLRSKPA